MIIELTDDDIEVIKELIIDWGHDPDYTNLSFDQLRPLAEKLGVWEPEQPPTKEQLEREEEFRNSPMAQFAAQMFSKCNQYVVEKLLADRNDIDFIKDSQLKTRLPNEYKVKE